MKKWDWLCLRVDFESHGEIWLESTSPNELKNLSAQIHSEISKYFSQAVGKIQINIQIKDKQTVIGHLVIIEVNPCTDRFYLGSINIIDLHCFVMNIIIENGWLPYPGNFTVRSPYPGYIYGNMFIRYYE